MILMVRQMFVQVLYPMWPAEESRLQNPQGGSLPHSELQSWLSIPFHKWQLSVACCIIVIFYSFLHGYMGKLMLWLDLGDAVVAACHLRCLGSNPLSCQHRRWRLLRIKAIIAVICCNTCHCLSLIATAKKGSKPFIVSSQMKAIAKPVCTAKNGKSCCFFKYFFNIISICLPVALSPRPKAPLGTPRKPWHMDSPATKDGSLCLLVNEKKNLHESLQIVVHIFHPEFWCLPGFTSKIQEALSKPRSFSVDVSRLSCLKRALVAWKPQAASNGGSISWSRTLSYRPEIRFTHSVKTDLPALPGRHIVT